MKIGLDAGHGLKTAGKQTPNGIKEWTLNDKVRDKVVAILKDYNVEFVFTDNDEGNADESLSARYKKYINENVDVFVSIHHNAFTGNWNDATGVEIYVDKNCTTKDMELANVIYKNLPNYTGLKGRGIKKENWYVINQNKVPAVLVEGGFMDSNNDYKVITSEAGQDGYARAVAEGLIAFLGLTKRTNDPQETPQYKYKVGDIVTINGVYISSTSANKLKPAVTKGTITKIVVGARNPYLLNDGNIGWINSDCIVSGETKQEAKPVKKTNEQIADEIINKPNYGGWGTGKERKDKLTKAGYDAKAIQDIINRKLG
jgi:N-acetylmuramoyl-L-alanine amidase